MRPTSQADIKTDYTSRLYLVDKMSPHNMYNYEGPAVLKCYHNKMIFIDISLDMAGKFTNVVLYYY